MLQERPDHDPSKMSDFAARAKAIVAALRTGEPGSAEMFEAFGELDALPVEAVRAAFAAWVGPLPDLENLDTATRIAHGLPLRALRLRSTDIAKDADILDLGTVAEDQVRLAGLSWDGHDRPAEERLDGELEGSFAGTLERRVLVDAESKTATPLFDVVLFAEDAGVVFAADTSRIVAMIAYGKVEMRDRRTRVAIEAALAEPAATPHAVEIAPRAPAPAAVVAPAPVAAPTMRTVERPAAKAAPATKKAAAKEPTTLAKRSVAKKSAAAKVAPKKTSAKKVVAKKTVAKKPAKKSVVKKGPAKKAPTKKVAKKAAPKKNVTSKKSAVKKSAAKTPKKKARR